MLVRWKKAGNSKQCFTSRLGAEIVVDCAAINLERTSNFSSKVTSCGYNLIILISRRIHHSKTDFHNGIKFLALYWKCACIGPIFFKMYSQNVFILGRFWIYKVWSSTVDTKNKISLYSDLSKEIHACPKCFWSYWTLLHSSWYFKTHARSDTCASQSTKI